MRTWKARLLVGFMLVAMMLATVAGPALANDGKNGNGFNGHGNNNNNNDCCGFNNFHHDDFDCCDNDDFDDFDDFGFFPFISVVDDVDFENVGERNSLEGECVPEDVDLDGFIAEWEITCFV